ncbi:MAG: CRISPR-associated endoribonuclease Cas6 [Bacteroidetes bacterium]|nr:CRISPR-associated endoribonuclease Cas6 [Bacteroidota bacterium]
MRVKISFMRDNTSANALPLHHQRLLFDGLANSIADVEGNRTDLIFSSLKGTSRIQNGFMKFLSSKVTLVVSSHNEEFLKALIARVFEKSFLPVGKMNILPKAQEVIPDPEFQTKMRYLCISPLILFDPAKDVARAGESLDPSSHEFSDVLYNQTMDSMEKAGFNAFDVQPDQDYIAKIQNSNKKFARVYRNSHDQNMMGYLIPFSMHAHADVHKFIWQRGLGVLNHEGYGMIDTVK